MITGSQIRAARGLLHWSAERLAEEAKLGVATIRRAEKADDVPNITEANIWAIKRAFHDAGVLLVIDGEITGGGRGVRWAASPGGERWDAGKFMDLLKKVKDAETN